MKTKQQKDTRQKLYVGKLIAWAAAFVLSANAADNYWQAVDGDWNGQYSDARHWSLGRVPAADDNANFYNTSGVEFVVEIDKVIGEGDIQTPALIQFGQYKSNVQNYPVRFIGSGKMAQTRTDIACFRENSQVIFDGNVSFDVTGNTENVSNRLVEVRGNASLTVNGKFYLGQYGSLVVSGGHFKCVEFRPSSPTRQFKVSGGEVDLGTVAGSCGFDNAVYSVAEFTGGSITYAGWGLKEPRLLPRNDAVFNTAYANNQAVYFTTPITNELSGSLFATNTTAAWVQMTGGNSVLHGRGEISTSTLNVNGSVGNIFDLSRVNVGQYLQIGSGGEVTFPRAVTFGAFGNWTSYPAWNTSTPVRYVLRCLDRVTLETTDCFDGSTVRNVSPAGLQLVPGMALRVMGGGTATIRFDDRIFSEASYASYADARPSIRSLEVAPSAAADLFAELYGVLRVGDLALDGTATLSTRADYNSFECAAPLNAPTARVTVSAAGLTADSSQTRATDKFIYPVVVAGGGDGIPLANVTLTDNSGTWHVKKVGPAIYLRDDTSKPEFSAPYLWTGAVNGDWNESGNWYGGNVPTSSSRVFFGICDTTNVVAIPAGGVTVEAFRGSGNTTEGAHLLSSEPYVFQGGKITITHNGSPDTNAAFLDFGRMPKYFECDVELSGNTGIAMPRKAISFLGGFTAKTLAMHGGELRFGGAATVQNLTLSRYRYEQQRDSTLTVMPGGSFTASAINSTVGTNAYFHILGGGTMTLNGTKFEYVNAPTLTNIVDGTLKINAPYSIDTDQCFVGTGRVDVASAYSGGAVAHQEICGGVRLNLGADFRTVTSANAAGAVVLSVPDFRDATLGLVADATYGPADGVTPSTTSAERALKIGYKAKLTIDTSDPDSGAAHTLTLKDPVTGGGDLTIIGGGRVVLAATGNRVGKFTLAGGTLSVAGLEEDVWTDVLVAESVAGLGEHSDGRIRFKTVENGDGTVTLSAMRVCSGFTFIVY